MSAAELRSFCAALVASPERMSVAASTTARPPARVVVRFWGVCAAGAAPVELPVAVRELEYAAGGLGFRLFPAALWAAAWFAARPAWLRNAAVLELGAGLGLLGLAAAKQGAAASVTLTDFNPQLLTALATAAADNGVAAHVAACDWADEAAAAEGAATAPAEKAAASVVSMARGCDGGGDAFARDANPEYYRVRAQLAASPSAPPGGDVAASLPAAASYDVALASEVLYEGHAAEALPALLARRLSPGGRFVTLMAVRDAALVHTCLTRCQAAGLQVALRRLADVALPPGDAAEAARAAAEAEALAPLGGPMCGGAWSDGKGAEWRALLATGGAGGGALEAAWLEARKPLDAPPVVQLLQAGPCCSRRARGLACPCGRAGMPSRAPPAAQPG